MSLPADVQEESLELWRFFPMELVGVPRPGVQVLKKHCCIWVDSQHGSGGRLMKKIKKLKMMKKMNKMKTSRWALIHNE